MNRREWTFIPTDDGFVAMKLVAASLALKPMSRHEAERKADKANKALASAEVATAFGPGDVVS